MKLLLSIRSLALVFIGSTLVSACGGGGGNPGTASGSSPVVPPVSIPTVSLDILNSSAASTSTVNNLETYTLRATVKDASGLPVDGVVVTFSDRSSLVSFSPADTALTKNGVASVVIAPKTPTSAGATMIAGDVTVSGSAAKQALKGVEVVPLSTGGNPSISIDLKNSSGATVNSVTSTDSFVLRATVRDSKGVVVAGQVVQFAGDAALVKFSPASGSALSDSNGVASVQVSPASSTSAGAGFLTANSTVSGTPANQALLGMQVIPLASGGVPSLSIDLKNSAGGATASITSFDSYVLRAVVRDSRGQPAVNQVVKFAGDPSLVKFLPASGTALTDSSGNAVVQVLPASGSAAGAGILTADTVVGGVVANQSVLGIQVIPLASAGVPSISVDLKTQTGASTSSMNVTGSYFVRAIVKDSKGVAVAGQLVKFAGDPSLFKFLPSNGTALTDSSGTASLQVSPLSGTASGAGVITADVSVAGVPATQALVGVQVLPLASGGLPSISVDLKTSAGASTSSITGSTTYVVRAMVKDSLGAAAVGQLVRFAGDPSLVKFTPSNGTALTDASGMATITVAPATGAAAGAGILTADVNIAGVSANQAIVGVQVVPLATAGKPTMHLSLVNSTTGAATSLINSSAVYTVRAVVSDSMGVPVAGQVVKIAGDASLVKFFPSNGAAVTDSTGLALIQVIPANGAASGAGFVTADVTVNGTAANQVSLGVQVVPSASGGLPTISMEMKNPAGNATSTLAVLDINTVRVTVRDALGAVVPGKSVTFGSVNGLVKFLPVSSAITDSNGQATVQVLRTSPSSSGVDILNAAVTVAGVQATPATLDIYVSPAANSGVAAMSMIFKDALGAGTSSVPRGTTVNANVTVLDTLGNPVPGALVTFTGDATLINFASTKLTNASGVASIPITAVASSDARASTLRATTTFTDTATNVAVTLAKSYDFEVIGGPTVSAQAPVISAVQIQNQLGANSTVVSAATNIYTVRATLKDSLGTVLPGQVIRFTGDPTLVKFSPANGTALTDQFGVGVVQVLPATATSSGAGLIGADATVANLAARQVTVGYTVVPLPNGGQSSIILRESGNTTTTVSALSSKTLSATVKDADGNPLPGQIVNFTTASNKLKFSPASSAVTNLSGIATVDITRNLPTDVGTEVVTANVTVGGVSVTPATMNVGISPLVNGGNPTATISLLDSSQSTSITTLNRSTTSYARVTLSDATGGVPVPTVVTLSGDATLLNFNATGLSDPITGVALIPLNVVTTSTGGASTLTARANVPATPGSSTLVPVAASIDYLVPSGSTAGVPTLTVGLQGGGTTVLATGASRAIATVKDASGAVVVGKIVSFVGNPALVKFSPSSGQVLTDNFGVASITVAPVSVLASGASTLSASTSVGAQALSTSFDFQLADSNVTLGTLSLGSNLAAYGTRAISIPVTVSGAIPASPVQVSFSQSCGTITPATATTDSLGIASATFTATGSSGCAGSSVSITASAVGATPKTGTISIDTVSATNLQFVSATPQLIYLADSVGPTQSQLIFKVVDASGNALANRTVRMSLPTNATGVGINAPGGLGPVDLTSDSSGSVSVAVFSGTVPTSFTVTGTLLDGLGVPTSVKASSNVLTVAVGRPAQRSLSLSLRERSIEGFDVDGVTTTVTLSLADRQGNPVPPGTQVNFVTQAGVMIPPTCFTTSVTDDRGNATSQCSVTIRSQGTRPVGGRVSIMAYAVGEEDFVDLDGNNIFSAGDTFTDLGRAFRDDFPINVTSVFNANPNFVTDNTISVDPLNPITIPQRSNNFTAGEFSVPRIGTSACVAGQNECTGDGVWGLADVRTQTTIIFSTSTAAIFNLSSLKTSDPAAGSPVANAVTPVRSLNYIQFLVSDINGNSLPTGTVIKLSASDLTSAVPLVNVNGNQVEKTCFLLNNPPSYTVGNTLLPMRITAQLKDCVAGDVVEVTATTPLNSLNRSTTTTATFRIQ